MAADFKLELGKKRCPFQSIQQPLTRDLGRPDWLVVCSTNKRGGLRWGKKRKNKKGAVLVVASWETKETICSPLSAEWLPWQVSKAAWKERGEKVACSQSRKEEGRGKKRCLWVDRAPAFLAGTIKKAEKAGRKREKYAYKHRNSSSLAIEVKRGFSFLLHNWWFLQQQLNYV